MSYKMFIDDERFPPNDGDWIICRNQWEVFDTIEEQGYPSFISFDHDLGENHPTGYDIAKELVDQDIALDWMKPEFDFYVHSQNPVGKANIEKYLHRYRSYKEAEKSQPVSA